MNNRITPYNITELKENEIFVFGSNSNGVHNGNAAATVMKFGAIMGQAVGIQGQTYADRKSTRLNSSHDRQSRMPSSA